MFFLSISIISGRRRWSLSSPMLRFAAVSFRVGNMFKCNLFSLDPGLSALSEGGENFSLLL